MVVNHAYNVGSYLFDWNAGPQRGDRPVDKRAFERNKEARRSSGALYVSTRIALIQPVRRDGYLPGEYAPETGKTG